MKKVKSIILSAVALSLVSGMFVFSQPKQVPNMCPVGPYPVSNVFSRAVQGLVGLNFTTAKVAEHEIKAQIAKTVKGDVDINITPYSALDLVAGKFKSVEVKAKNVNLDGLYISAFEAKTLCDFVYIDYKHDPIAPLAPAFIKFKGTVTQDDFNKILASPQYGQNLTKIKAQIGNADINLVDFLNPRIDIKDGLIYLSAQVHLAGMPSYFNMPIKVGTGLKIENNKLKLCNLKIVQNQGMTLPIASNFIESISPVLVDLNKVGIQGSKIIVKNLSINNDKIDVGGTVWIPAK